jgi:hypothetical protein
MIPPKVLLIIAFNYLTGFAETLHIAHQLPGACQEIQVTWTKSDTTEGQSNGSIILTFAGKRSDYAVYLLTPGGKTKLKSTELAIRNLKKGKHVVVITGEREGLDFCQKFFEVVIN